MAEGTYWTGVGAVVVYVPDSTGIPIAVNNTEWNKTQKARLGEVTNAQSAGSTKWIAGPREQNGSIPINWDSSVPPVSVGIIEGTTGVIREYYGNSGRYKSQAVIIESLDYKANTQNAAAIAYTLSYRGNGPIVEN